MLIKAFERRFGSVNASPAAHALKFLSDYGAAYMGAETRVLARALGLKPNNTALCSPQQRHGREFHQQIPVRLCGAHGPE